MVPYLNVIAKTTNACNLKCSYCYTLGVASKGKMSTATAHKLLEQATEVARSANITWHGGEPLLLGLDFYRSVARKSNQLRATGRTLRNTIQSNGTLLTNELLDFIEEEDDFGIGLSLDGPKHFNDQTRVFKKGAGSFDAIMQALDKVRTRERVGLKRRFSGGVICVVGKHDIGHLSEIYRFFRDEGVSVAFNLLTPSGRATKEMEAESHACAQAYSDLFDIWIDDAIQVDVRPFSEILASLLSAKPRGCYAAPSCADSFVSISPRGDVYPCGRFDGSTDFKLGSIASKNGLQGALDSATHRRLRERPISIQSHCSGCDFVSVCNGGCMHSAFAAGDILNKDPHCEFYKLLNSHIVERIRREFAIARKNSHELRSGRSTVVNEFGLVFDFNLDLIANDKIRRIAKNALPRGVSCWFSDRYSDTSHTDHNDRSYKDHTDHTDRIYSDHKDNYDDSAM